MPCKFKSEIVSEVGLPWFKIPITEYRIRPIHINVFPSSCFFNRFLFSFILSLFLINKPQKYQHVQDVGFEDIWNQLLFLSYIKIVFFLFILRFIGKSCSNANFLLWICGLNTCMWIGNLPSNLFLLIYLKQICLVIFTILSGKL